MWRLLSVSLLLVGCARAEKPPVKAAEPVAVPLPPAPVVPVPGAPSSFVQLVKLARASVVNIHTLAIIKARPQMVFPFGEDSPFYQLIQPPEQRAQSLGTGFIISADGDIVTNNHVVSPEELGGRAADEITVSLDDKRQFKAKVIARDRKSTRLNSSHA